VIKAFHDCLFSRNFALVCLAGIVVALLAHREGMGFSVCGLQRLSGLPCPACGLTRSVSCFFQAHWGEAVRFNLFGPMAALAMVFFGGLFFAPRRIVLRWRGALDRHETVVCVAYVTFTVLFFAFGVIRLVMVWRSAGESNWLTCMFVR
jgi:hypothetical protein